MSKTPPSLFARDYSEKEGCWRNERSLLGTIVGRNKVRLELGMARAVGRRAAYLR
jgi:hypothetical protein